METVQPVLIQSCDTLVNGDGCLTQDVIFLIDDLVKHVKEELRSRLTVRQLIITYVSTTQLPRHLNKSEPGYIRDTH